MRFTTALRLALFLAVLALPADALAAGAVQTSSVTGRLVVPAGRAGTIGLRCPSGAVAANAAITRKGEGVVVRRSTPGEGGDDWAFRVAASGSGSRTVSAVLRCVGVRLPAGFTNARLHTNTRSRAGVALAPGATRTLRLLCGPAWTATGYALSPGGRGDVRIAEAVPGPHGWRLTLENIGSAAARAGVSARCIRSKVAATGPAGTAQLAFVAGRSARSRVLAPGSNTYTQSCGSRFTLATGVSVDPASQVALAGSSPVGPASGRWIFRNASGGEDALTFMVCLSRASRFR